MYVHACVLALVRASIRICPGGNFHIHAWISKYTTAKVNNACWLVVVLILTALCDSISVYIGSSPRGGGGGGGGGDRIDKS